MKSGDQLIESSIHTVFRILNLRYKTSHHCEQRSEYRNESSYSQNIIQTYSSRVPVAIITIRLGKPFVNITDPSGAQFDFVFISTFGFSSEC